MKSLLDPSFTWEGFTFYIGQKIYVGTPSNAYVVTELTNTHIALNFSKSGDLLQLQLFEDMFSSASEIHEIPS